MTYTYRENVLKPEPGIRTAVAGCYQNRNGPCPCGSGRKWKKCCGAAAGYVAKTPVREFHPLDQTVEVQFR